MFQLTWKDQTGWRRQATSHAIPAPPPDRPVRGVAFLVWEEHCVECAVPFCYSSCSLYMRRRDQKCARFAYGIYPNRQVSGLFGYGADIQFRRWAKLEATVPETPALVSVRHLRRQAAVIHGLENAVSAAASLLRPIDPRRRLNALFTLGLTRWTERKAEALSATRPPEALYLKFFYPGREGVRLQLEVVQDRPTFRASLPVLPGWNEHIIPFSDLRREPGPGAIRLWPENDAEIRLIITWLDLVRFAQGASSKAIGGTRSTPAEKVKCVAWDLDDTLWRGVIGDLGVDRVGPLRHVIGIIRCLDERGILQTVASKNDFDAAWGKICQLGLQDYFLYPAIHWGPKSESLRSVAKELNIDLNTFALVDDSPFERAEVATACPQVRLYEPSALTGLLERSEFDVPVTEESRTRRLKYLAESQRKRIAAAWRGNYDTFLRSCGMRMQIRRPGAADRTRCLELMQRSNQFNLSGRCYTSQEWHALLGDPGHECFAFKVADVHGDYGLVGFAAIRVEPEAPMLVEFIMSCRVAQKRVDDTFIAWYADRARGLGARLLRARLTATDRNGPLQASLKALAFRCVSRSGAEQLLELRLRESVKVPPIIRVEAG